MKPLVLSCRTLPGFMPQGCHISFTAATLGRARLQPTRCLVACLTIPSIPDKYYIYIIIIYNNLSYIIGQELKAIKPRCLGILYPRSKTLTTGRDSFSRGEIPGHQEQTKSRRNSKHAHSSFLVLSSHHLEKDTHKREYSDYIKSLKLVLSSAQACPKCRRKSGCSGRPCSFLPSAQTDRQCKHCDCE